MVQKLFFCLLLLAVADGSQHRQNDINKIARIYERSLRPRLTFPSWYHQYRLDPWFLRWPSLWRLETHRNDLNIASVKRRRRWTKYRTRRSKWSKLYSKHEFNNKIPRHSPELPWINQNNAPITAKEFSKTSESASYYAIPTWLQRLRKDLNQGKNKVDALHNTFISNLSPEIYPKVTSIRWNERPGQTSAVFKQTILPPKPKFQSPLFEKDDLLGSFSGKGQDDKTQAKFSLTHLDPNQGSQSNDPQTAEAASGLSAYSSGVDDAFYPSEDSSDNLKSQENSGEYVRDDLFSLSNGKMETRQHQENGEDKADGQSMASGLLMGSSGEPFPEFPTDTKMSSGSSFGHIDDPVKPAERSGNPTIDDGFGSFDYFPDEDYLAYMDFDESGFGTFGGLVPHEEGAFLDESENCEGVDTRSCKIDADCSCMGIYFCVKDSCSTISTSSNDNGMPAEMKGIWHEAPMAE